MQFTTWFGEKQVFNLCRVPGRPCRKSLASRCCSPTRWTSSKQHCSQQAISVCLFRMPLTFLVVDVLGPWLIKPIDEVSEKFGHVYVIIWSLLTVRVTFSCKSWIATLRLRWCKRCTVTYNNNYPKSLKLVPTTVVWTVLHTKKTNKKSPCQPLVRCCHDYFLFKDVRGK